MRTRPKAAGGAERRAPHSPLAGMRHGGPPCPAAWRFPAELNMPSRAAQLSRALVFTPMGGKLTSAQNPAHDCLPQLHPESPKPRRRQAALQRVMEKQTGAHPDNGTLFRVKRKRTIKPRRDLEGSQSTSLREGSRSEKAAYRTSPAPRHSGEGEPVETPPGSVGARGGRGDRRAGRRGMLGRRYYSLRYSNSRRMVNPCPHPQSVDTGALTETMDLEWLRRIHVGASIVAYGPLWQGTLIVLVRGQG